MKQIENSVYLFNLEVTVQNFLEPEKLKIGHVGTFFFGSLGI